MRRFLLILSLGLMLLGSGCAVSDMLLGVFGEKHYSGGGDSYGDKSYHLNQQHEAARDYAAANE